MICAVPGPMALTWKVPGTDAGPTVTASVLEDDTPNDPVAVMSTGRVAPSNAFGLAISCFPIGIICVIKFLPV